MDKDLHQTAADAARIMNYRKHAEQLSVPVLKGFERKDDGNPLTILLAEGYGFTEQLTSDGHIESDQFEQHVDLAINNTKQFMLNNGCENVDGSFIYYKDYKSETFQFKLYFCDMIAQVGGERKIIRQLIAYFFEPKMRDFYQLTLSVGPFAMPTEKLKPGIIDLQDDQVTATLDKMMTTLMDNIQYRQ